MPKKPPPSYADIRRNFDDASRMLKEAAQTIKELGKRQEETERSIDRMSAELGNIGNRTERSIDRMSAELGNIGSRTEQSIDRMSAELGNIGSRTEQSMDRMSAELGNIGSSEGLIFEEEAAEAVRNAEKIGNIRLDKVVEDLRSFDGNQFDIVGVNGNYVVLIEVKRTLRRDDIVRLAERGIPALKNDFANAIKGKKVKGAIIYRRMGGKPDARCEIAREALSRGLILVRAVGKNELYPIKTPDEVSIPVRQLKAAK